MTVSKTICPLPTIVWFQSVFFLKPAIGVQAQLKDKYFSFLMFCSQIFCCFLFFHFKILKLAFSVVKGFEKYLFQTDVADEK